jgi:hypothetical protein
LPSAIFASRSFVLLARIALLHWLDTTTLHFAFAFIALHCWLGTLPYDGILERSSRPIELSFHHFTFLEALVQNEQ